MQTAQVTSSLLKFPEVTIQASGKDEVTLDSELSGKISRGRNGLAWLACGPQLEVVNSVTGQWLSAYRFSEVKKQTPTVRVVKEFSWQKRTGLLVGLEVTKGSLLCLYDLGISRVVKAVALPGKVTAIEPIAGHEGASASAQHLHQSPQCIFGVVAVATDVGHLLLVDLCLDDLSCSQSELEASDPEVVTRTPAEVTEQREILRREGKQLCLQLQSPSGTGISTLCYIKRSNQLVVGFSDGYLSLWNMKTLMREHHSQLEGGNIPVYAVTFQEPENDPQNCCYLWAVQSTQESEGKVLSLHLLQLAFSDRKHLASGQVMYEGLKYCDERYNLDLTGGIVPLRRQTTSTKLLSCQTVEEFHNSVEDSINEVISPSTSLSIFSWQVKMHSQRKPSTYLGVFDINRWYHAQMPDSTRPEEFLHDCPYFALWSLDTVVNMTAPHLFLDILVHEWSLSQGVPSSHPPPEQYFNTSNYNFDGTCLLNSGVVHVTCTGFQKETLKFFKKYVPSISEDIHDSYNRCFVADLLSPRLVDVQPSSLSQKEQLEAVLSAAVQTCSLQLPVKCIKRWTSEGSSNNLQFVLQWTWNKVIDTKEEFDQICVLLFDGSCNFIDSQTLQSLRLCQLLLSNLSVILNCFLTETRNITETGFRDLRNKHMVASLISLYARVVIWFCQSSLLPEGLDEDMQLSRPFYNYPLIQSYYTGRQQQLECLSRGKWDSDCLMIDGMVSQLGDKVEKLWQRDGVTGKYPPASYHALLDLYLIENVSENSKHAITIYFLLDVMDCFPNKTDTWIKSFSAAFGIPCGLVRLVQGFWLLDHSDYEKSLALLFHPATMRAESWQHNRIIESLVCQGEHRQALRYVQMMRPPMSSSKVRLFLAVLLSNRCMEEAWDLLQQPVTRQNREELLKHAYEVCQEMGLMDDFLNLPFSTADLKCLEKCLETDARVQNQVLRLVCPLLYSSYLRVLQPEQSKKDNLMYSKQSKKDNLMVPPAQPHPLPNGKLPNAFLGTPVTRRYRRCFRLLGIEIYSDPSRSAAKCDIYKLPYRASTFFMASRLLKSNMHGYMSQKNFPRAPERNLLQTPLTLTKRAEDMAKSTPVSGFSGFKPQSILKSSLRATTLATSSASPGQSVTPPLRAKEYRVSFREENSNAKETIKTPPRAQRNLSLEKLHYRSPSSVSRGDSRPKPLSTVAKEQIRGILRGIAALIGGVFSKIRELWVRNQHPVVPSPKEEITDSDSLP